MRGGHFVINPPGARGGCHPRRYGSRYGQLLSCVVVRTGFSARPDGATAGSKQGCGHRHEPHRDSPFDPRHAPAGGPDRRSAPPDHRPARAARRRGQRAAPHELFPAALAACVSTTLVHVRAHEGLGSRRGTRRRRLRPSLDSAQFEIAIRARRRPRPTHTRAARPGRARVPASPVDRGRDRVRRDASSAGAPRRSSEAGVHREQEADRRSSAAAPAAR